MRMNAPMGMGWGKEEDEEEEEGGAQPFENNILICCDECKCADTNRNEVGRGEEEGIKRQKNNNVQHVRMRHALPMGQELSKRD